LAEQNKSNYVMISSILDEVAALRETVRGLDPTFDEVLAQKRAEHSTADIAVSVIGLSDAIIQRLKDGYVC
jgi:hypothetical protein